MNNNQTTLSGFVTQTNSNSFVFCCSWALTLPPVSSMRLVIVVADRLAVLKTSFFSGHTTSTTAFMHFLTNSSVKGLLLPAISWATRTLARVDAWFSWAWRTNVFCWANGPLFSFESLSVHVWPCKRSYLYLWRYSWCHRRLYCLNTATSSRQMSEAAFSLHWTKKWWFVHCRLNAPRSECVFLLPNLIAIIAFSLWEGRIKDFFVCSVLHM